MLECPVCSGRCGAPPRLDDAPHHALGWALFDIILWFFFSL
jgi:hypothetical protein